MTNRWNQFIYRLWAPVYDASVDHIFTPGRKRALELLALQPGECVLIIGVGTGADLPLLPAGVKAVGIDISPTMLARARRKPPVCQASVRLIQGDAQATSVRDNIFDAAILNLILSVVPDGHACLSSTLLALKPAGRAVVFDKFLPDNNNLTVRRKVLNWFSTMFGTDITRKFGKINAGCPDEIIWNEPSILRGTYRIILLRKNQFPAKL
jgi:ubiquinone/menaquinone biosynthesis C-methylase UbiE